MEKKKMKTYKKVLIIILIILFMYFITVFIKYSILTKISVNYEKARESDNFYYYSETETTIINYWQKDSIKKLNIKDVDREKDLTFWKDENTGEELLFVEFNKTYSKTQGAMYVNLISSQFVPLKEEKLIRFAISLNPTVFVFSDIYDDTECYTIKHLGNGIVTEKVDKQTGLLLYSAYNKLGPTTRKYKFDSVTDENINKPDISKYELIEDN